MKAPLIIITTFLAVAGCIEGVSGPTGQEGTQGPKGQIGA